MKLFLTSILFLGTSFIANAQERVFIDETEDGDKFYLIPSTIKKVENKYISASIETTYGHIQYEKVKKKFYTNSSSQWLIDCKDKKASQISYTSYNKNGEEVNSDTISDKEAKETLNIIRPDTIAYFIIEASCNWDNNY